MFLLKYTKQTTYVFLSNKLQTNTIELALKTKKYVYFFLNK